eukprot:613629-Pleurochrysis_carterae.AAC.1
MFTYARPTEVATRDPRTDRGEAIDADRVVALGSRSSKKTHRYIQKDHVYIRKTHWFLREETYTHIVAKCASLYLWTR